MKKVKIAVIGVGNIAESHIEAYQANPNVELYAFCDINKERLEEKGARFGITRLYTDEAEMLKALPELDAVSVCTWNSQHAPCTILALEAGKNVLVEKPFTPTLAQAKELFALAKSKGLTVTPYQNRRFDSCFLTAKKAIESGKLGEIVEVESHFDYYRPVAETKPGLPQDGAFYGLGVHTMDQIISLFGRPDHVAYDIRSLRNKANPDDTFEAQLFYGDLKAIVKSGALITLILPFVYIFYTMTVLPAF